MLSRRPRAAMPAAHPAAAFHEASGAATKEEAEGLNGGDANHPGRRRRPAPHSVQERSDASVLLRARAGIIRGENRRASKATLRRQVALTGRRSHLKGSLPRQTNRSKPREFLVIPRKPWKGLGRSQTAFIYLS